MKKIINGKVYDTDTAKKCGEWHNGKFEVETLYQKKTGEFFKCNRSNTVPLAYIMPLTYYGAQKWAEKHLDADDYISLFGEPVEDDSKTRLNLYVSTALAAKLKTEAAKQNISIGDYLETIIK